MTKDKQSPAPLPSPSWREWILWLFRKRIRLKVTGESMLPTVKPNDIVLIDKKAYVKSSPKLGEVVLAHHPYMSITIIKRVSDITPEGRIVLTSDNPQVGSDSRQFGSITSKRIIGRVTSRSSVAN